MPSIDKLLGPNGPRRFRGSYTATVTNNEDPQKRGRLKVLCPEVYGSAQSPWVEYSSVYGGMGDGGDAEIPEKGASIRIKFKNGDPNLPQFDGSASPAKSLPKLAKGEKDRTRREKGKLIKFDSFREDKEITDPLDPFAATYPNNKVRKTASGHVIEFDDTKGHERVNIHHRAGSHIEMNPDGSVVVYSAKNKYEAVEGDHAQQLKGDSDYKYEKDVGVVIDKDGNILIKGDLTLIIEGDLNVQVRREFSIAAERGINITSGANTNISTKRSLTIAQSDSTIVDVGR